MKTPGELVVQLAHSAFHNFWCFTHAKAPFGLLRALYKIKHHPLKDYLVRGMLAIIKINYIFVYVLSCSIQIRKAKDTYYELV